MVPTLFNDQSDFGNARVFCRMESKGLFWRIPSSQCSQSCEKSVAAHQNDLVQVFHIYGYPWISMAIYWKLPLICTLHWTHLRQLPCLAATSLKKQAQSCLRLTLNAIVVNAICMANWFEISSNKSTNKSKVHSKQTLLKLHSQIQTRFSRMWILQSGFEQ